MGQFAFLVIRQASGEVIQRWEPLDPFEPSLDIRVGQQFHTKSGRYTVVSFDLYGERDPDADVNGIIEVV